jgi:quercetin dioxygenase-like cupin family protein
MEIQPKKPSVRGPAEWFTGHVWIDAIARGEAPSRLAVSAVHFTPGAHTAWHEVPPV